MRFYFKCAEKDEDVVVVDGTAAAPAAPVESFTGPPPPPLAVDDDNDRLVPRSAFHPRPPLGSIAQSVQSLPQPLQALTVVVVVVAIDPCGPRPLPDILRLASQRQPITQLKHAIHIATSQRWIRIHIDVAFSPDDVGGQQ